MNEISKIAVLGVSGLTASVTVDIVDINEALSLITQIVILSVTLFAILKKMWNKRKPV